MYRLCVFDMDGTVVNSIADIAAAMNRSLEKMGYSTYDIGEYCRMVGDGMEMLCRRAIKVGDEEEVQRLIKLYKEDYFSHCCENSSMYDGMEDVIYALREKGVRCAILSNKPHEQVQEISRKLFGSNMFDEIWGYTPQFPVKPAPDSLFAMIGKLGVFKEETAYIGDSDVDVRLGKAAQVFTVGVSWGLRGEEELVKEGADAIVQTPEELISILIKK